MKAIPLKHFGCQYTFVKHSHSKVWIENSTQFLYIYADPEKYFLISQISCQIPYKGTWHRSKKIHDVKENGSNVDTKISDSIFNFLIFNAWKSFGLFIMTEWDTVCSLSYLEAS